MENMESRKKTCLEQDLQAAIEGFEKDESFAVTGLINILRGDVSKYDKELVLKAKRALADKGYLHG